MNLIVNGNPHEHNGDGTVSALLAEIGATPKHSALTVNGNLVPFKQWNAHPLNKNDHIEVLTFVGGG